MDEEFVIIRFQQLGENNSNSIHIHSAEIIAIEFGTPSFIYASGGAKWRVSHSTAEAVEKELGWDVLY